MASLKTDYIRTHVGKMRAGPGGWRCQCCNPFFCHPANMKRKARRRVRRGERMAKLNAEE